MKIKKKTNGEEKKKKTQRLDEVILDESLKTKELFKPQGKNDTNELVILSDAKKKSKDAKTKQQSEIAPVKKLSKKERKRLENVLKKKEKSSKREALLEKLASLHFKPTELNLYRSVKDISKKEKKKKSKEGPKNERRRENDEDENNQEVLVETPIAVNNGRKKLKTENKTTKSAAKIETNNEKEKEEEKEPEPKEETIPEENKVVEENGSKRKTKYVHVDRTPEITEYRSKLPIITEEQVIMETLSENDIVIICGETGSGKTTQVPQFLYEAGYTEDGFMIGITEPRRVAAISMSRRVNEEMNFKADENKVSYQIRYEGNQTLDTRIKFMTDGVLLKELQTDFMLNKYSAIIIDEAHERSVFTDILIGLLSRIVPLRNKRGKPLKLIIMSATLRVEDFTKNERLFKTPPPVIKVDARQFPVAIHFNRHTYEDYIGEAYRKVCKIHKRLPEGGILIFLTGQQEVNLLCEKLKRTFPPKSGAAKNSQDENKKSSNNNNNSKKRKKPDSEEANQNSGQTVNLDSYSAMPIDEELEMLENQQSKEQVIDEEEENLDDIDVDEGEDEDLDEMDPLKNASNSGEYKPLYVLPLYSLLSTERQSQIFGPVPPGHRLCVVSTNIAETSLTIPNIKYVVDTGRVKTKFYDRLTGVTTFRVTWTSKASADQRSGRAGRTAPGHCYRLYSSAVYNDEFPLFSEPELKRKPIEDLVLQMKDLGIDRIVNFPFPTPPEPEAVRASEQLLIRLGALEYDPNRKKSNKEDQITRITKLGKTMSCFPVNPRYAKMLALAAQQSSSDTSILSYIICLISGLSVQELFVDSTKLSKEPNQPSVKYSELRETWLQGAPGSHSQLLGDLMLILVAIGAVEYETDDKKCAEFCEQFGVRYKAVVEARKLRRQLVSTINMLHTEPKINLSIDPHMQPPSEAEAKVLRQIVMSCMPDRLAKLRLVESNSDEEKKLKNSYESLLLEQPMFIHPSSVLFKQVPSYVCFVDIIETSKIYMRCVCALESDWLPQFLPNECSFGPPLVDSNDAAKEPRFDVNKGVVVCYRESTFGKLMWPIRAVEVEWQPADLDLYKWFARFLLEGKVVDALKKYEGVLLGSPTTMLKSWAKLQPRTEKLLNALISQSCSTRQKLLSIWTTKPDYLLEEYSMWVPESLHFELRLKWPPISK